MSRYVSRPLRSLSPRRLPGSGNQTLPQLPVRINRSTPHVMVLLPSGRRHTVPRTATNLERPGEAVSVASPLPAISVRTILPLARLVHQLEQAKEESHAEQTASTI